MINKHLVSALLLGAALVFAPWAASSPAVAMTDEVGSYLGPEPTLFDTPEAAIAAFKDVMAKGDLNAPSIAWFKWIDGRYVEVDPKTLAPPLLDTTP